MSACLEDTGSPHYTPWLKFFTISAVFLDIVVPKQRVLLFLKSDQFGALEGN